MNEEKGNPVRKILLVDDSQLVCQKMKKLLADEGYPIETAYNGIEALKIIAEKDFDLVLLDIEMPEMNGFETCRKLRSEEKTRLLPQVVFFSSSTQSSHKVKGLSLGVSDFIEKSMAWEHKDEFCARIEAHLRIAQLLREKLELEKLGVLRATAVSVNHEIANPLQTISLAVNRLRNCEKDDPKSSVYFESVSANIGKISEILRKLANAVNSTTGEYAGGEEMIDMDAILVEKEKGERVE